MTRRIHRRILIASIAGLALAQPTFVRAQAAFSFTAGGLTYSENFDGMGATGTTYPTGWGGARLAGSGTIGAALALTVNNGGTNAGGLYNVGTTSATDRALGTLSSGSTVPAFGAFLTNDTGTAITLLNLTGFAEQWRSGDSTAVNESVLFEYSFDATNLTTGVWTAFAPFSLNEVLIASSAAAAVDGNTNRTLILNQLALDWATGTNLWFRWRDTNDAGADGMYAIDDLVITASTNTAKNLTWNGAGGTWDTVAQNFNDGAAPSLFATGDNVTFGDAGLGQSTVTVAAGGVSPRAVRFENTSGTYTVTGGAITGSGALTKVGAGTLALGAPYGNAIAVQAGTMITTAVNVISDIAGLSVDSGATAEIGAAETIGPVTLAGGKLKATAATTAAGDFTVNTAATNSIIEGTVTLSGTRKITLSNNATLDLTAALTSTVGSQFQITGYGTVNLTADNTATLQSNVQLNPLSTLRVTSAGSLGTRQIFLNGGTLAAVAGATPLVFPNTVSLGGSPNFDAARDFEFSGAWSFFNLGGKTLTVNNTTKITATIGGGSGASFITIRGSGRLIIAGLDNAFTSIAADGTDGGTLQWDGTVAATGAPTADVVNSGRLTGSGTLGPVTVTNGFLAPGTPADLTATLSAGNFTMLGGGTLQMQIGGLAAGESDKLAITGAVALDGTLALSILGGTTLVENDALTLIDNDSTDLVSGTFAGMLEASSFTADGVQFRISYAGGDGNDVTITVIPEPTGAALLLGGLAVLAGRRRATRKPAPALSRCGVA